jgi:hypothetical protein
MAALLEAVAAFPPDHPRVPCCRSCGTSCVILGGYGVPLAGEFEGIIEKGVVVQQEDGELLVPPPPHGSAACCAWAGGAATSSWVGPVPSTTALATSSARRPAHHHQPAGTKKPRRLKGTAARRSVAEAESLRRNHIAVERNRRRQVNEHLAALRTLMPPSYARRVRRAAPSVAPLLVTFHCAHVKIIVISSL